MGLYTIALSGLLILPIGYAVNQLIDVGQDFRHLRWDWHWPGLANARILLLLGAVGMAAYMMVSRAYQIANASLIRAVRLHLSALGGDHGLFRLGRDSRLEHPGQHGHDHRQRPLPGLPGDPPGPAKPRAPTPTGEVVFVPGGPSGGSNYYSDSHDGQRPPEA